MTFTDIIKTMLWCQLVERVIKRCFEIVANDPRISEETFRWIKTNISLGLAMVHDINVELTDIFRGNDRLLVERYQEIKARMVDTFQRFALFFNDDGDVSIFENEWNEIDQGPITSERKAVYYVSIRDWFDNVYSGSQGTHGTSADLARDTISLREHYRPEVTMLNDHDGSADAIISLREHRRLVIKIRDHELDVRRR